MAKLKKTHIQKISANAEDYLNYTSFSHDGLIDQLIYEKFTPEEATQGIDRLTVDWNEQAAKKAKECLNFSSFSQDGLVDQLIYEKFTPDQAAYGAAPAYQ